jgi:aminopeptidase-like protein
VSPHAEQISTLKFTLPVVLLIDWTVPEQKWNAKNACVKNTAFPIDWIADVVFLSHCIQNLSRAVGKHLLK